MSHTAPTVAQFKARFGAVFLTVDDATVLAAITRGLRMVDTTWTDGDYTEGAMLYAAHWLTLSGIGASADAGNNSGDASGFSEIRSGQLTLKRKSAADQGGNDGTLDGSTVYGRQYLALMRLNRGGHAGVAVFGAVDLPAWPYYRVPYNGGFGS